TTISAGSLHELARKSLLLTTGVTSSTRRISSPFVRVTCGDAFGRSQYRSRRSLSTDRPVIAITRGWPDTVTLSVNHQVIPDQIQFLQHLEPVGTLVAQVGMHGLELPHRHTADSIGAAHESSRHLVPKVGNANRSRILRNGRMHRDFPTQLPGRCGSRCR